MNNKSNRIYLLIALLGTLVQWIIFKILYPYPDFFSDSYSYIYGAYAKLDINIWPIGYSKFLLAFHHLTHSDTALVSFQYFFFELSALYFFFTIQYVFQPKRSSRNILFIFLFFNPLFLYLCNYINSDPIFVALSLLWITELIWIVHRPRLYQIFTQAVLVFLAFTVRNNAYFYPVIALLAFVLSRQPNWKKIVGPIAGLVLIIPFIIHSENVSFRMTGTRQFSLFTGWQLANNALYMYEKIKVDSTVWKSAEAIQLDSISRSFFRHIKNDEDYRDYLSVYVGNFFIREPEAPLKQYLSLHDYKHDPGGLIAWGRASAVFAPYGSTLIKTHPMAYAEYFMLLNSKHYFFPPLEKLAVYNLGIDDVWPEAQYWFDYHSSKITAVSKPAQGYILVVFTFLFAFLHLYFIGYLVWLLAGRKYRYLPRILNQTLLVGSLFLFANFAFCVFATIIVLRYEVFPMIVIATLLLLLIDAYPRAQNALNAIE